MLIHEKVNDLVDRVKMVEEFLQRADMQGHFHPELERKLGRHRLSASFDAKTVNIWQYGDAQDDEHSGGLEGGQKKRHISITNILPVMNAETDLNSGNKGYEKLSKAEKKQIKRDLLEFAKRTQR